MGEAEEQPVLKQPPEVKTKSVATQAENCSPVSTINFNSVSSNQFKNSSTVQEHVGLGLLPNDETLSHMATVKGKIENQVVNFVIDSGSGISVIGIDLIKQIPQLSGKQLITCPEMSVRSVKGQFLKICGALRINLELCGEQISHLVYVADNFYFDLLIGTDLLSTFGVIIDFASKCIIIKHSKAPIRTDLPPNPVIVRVNETCSVPARSEICLLLKTEGNVDGLPGVVEPKLFNKNSQSFLHFARVLGMPEHGVVPVRLLNLSSDPQIIYKNSKVGRFEPVRKDMIALTQPIETSDLTENETEKTPENEANSSKTENTHLHEISVDFSKSNLTFAQQNQLKNFLNEFHDIFAKDEHDLGKTDIVQHKIDVGDGFCHFMTLWPYGPMAPYSCFKKLWEINKTSHFSILF